MILERSAVSVLLSLFLTGMYKEAMMANVTEWAELVADSGMALLRNGAETYRTNETMEYMATPPDTPPTSSKIANKN